MFWLFSGLLDARILDLIQNITIIFAYLYFMFEDFRLKVFIMTAREGSFTRAASRLNISQPAVSQNIAEIEKALNIQLFERLHGSIKLTSEGHVFLSYAKNILSSYAELEAIFADFPAISSLKVIRLAVAPDCVAEITSSLLPYIYGICPKVAVAIMQTPCEGADITITRESAIPSTAFNEHPVWPLLRAKLSKRS